MSAETIIVVLLGGLVVAGAVTGVVLILRRVDVEAGELEADPLTPRVVAEVHAGEEQVLLHLARSLALPADRDAVGYGEIYIAGSVGTTLQLASRSEIGRGFDAEIRIHRIRSASVAEYAILRLPGDETVRRHVHTLDTRIAGALLDLDPAARIRTADRARGLLPQR